MPTEADERQWRDMLEQLGIENVQETLKDRNVGTGPVGPTRQFIEEWLYLKKQRRAIRSFFCNTFMGGSAASLIAAVFCWGYAILGWLKYGDWHYPGWTLGATFGIGHNTFPDAVGLQKIVDSIVPISPGWGFLALGVLLTAVASRFDPNRTLGR
jgi:hypothetical protein